MDRLQKIEPNGKVAIPSQGNVGSPRMGNGMNPMNGVAMPPDGSMMRAPMMSNAPPQGYGTPTSNAMGTPGTSGTSGTPGPMADGNQMGNQMEGGERKEKKKVPRLSHKKSRNGCRRCKARRVKVSLRPFFWSHLFAISVCTFLSRMRYGFRCFEPTGDLEPLAVVKCLVPCIVMPLAEGLPIHVAQANTQHAFQPILRDSLTRRNSVMKSIQSAAIASDTMSPVNLSECPTRQALAMGHRNPEVLLPWACPWESRQLGD